VNTKLNNQTKDYHLWIKTLSPYLIPPIAPSPSLMFAAFLIKPSVICGVYKD
jgi:hypothetical protein